MDLLAGVMLIVSGLVLLTGVLYLVPAFGKSLERLAKWLGSFQGIIGIIAIIVGLLSLGDLLGALLLIIVGLILAVGILSALPGIGKSLAKVAKFFGGFQTVIGIIALILGIWLLL